MATATEIAPPPVVDATKAPPVVVPPVAKVETPPAVVVPPVEAAKAPEVARSLLADPPKVETPPVAEAKTGEQPPTEWKLEVPKDSGLTAEHLKQVEAWAKPLGLTAAQAQKMVERDATAKAAVIAESKAQVAKTLTDWTAEATAKFGTKLPEVQQNAKRALTQYDKTGVFRKILNETPYGSNAPLLEFLNEVGAALREDSAADAGNASAPPQPKSATEAFYGKDHTKPSF